MKTNPNNLPESWCIYNDGSPEFKKFLIEFEKMSGTPGLTGDTKFYGKQGHFFKASMEKFGQLLTLSEFERLSKPVEMCGSDSCPVDGACEHCQNPVTPEHHKDCKCNSCKMERWYELNPEQLKEKTKRVTPAQFWARESKNYDTYMVTSTNTITFKEKDLYRFMEEYSKTVKG